MNSSKDADFLAEFQEAIEGGRIRAFFQPVYRSLNQRFFAAEALASWFDPSGKMISPAEFIPALEESGHVFELDMEILRQACALYEECRRRGTPVAGLSVNLSRQDFSHEDLFEKVCGILKAYRVPHDAIKLEITESLMIEDPETFEKAFRHFRDAGFSVWLDDFGSGYSSLNVLQHYNFDVIKFDMLFLRELSFRGKEMLASMISMAKSLEIHTLAEGVETDEQREFLLALGCEAQQGFYYARPMARDAFLEMIDRKPEILEKPEEVDYWNRIGRVNFVNPNPMKEFAERRVTLTNLSARVSSYDGSIALVECTRDDFKYIYATEGYRERLRDLGFATVGGVESALSNQRSYQYLMIRKLVLDALKSGEIQTVEYAYKDVYFRLSALFIARREGRAMILMRLNTFDSEREAETAGEMLKSSSALLTTYDLVVMFYPERNAAKRVFTSNNMPEYDRETSMERSLKKFCEAEVDMMDQARYLRFLDFSTMPERVEKSCRKCIQSLFRMKLGRPDQKSRWYSARVTQIPSSTEPTFMLTVQSIQENLEHRIDQMVGEHPELLAIR